MSPEAGGDWGVIAEAPAKLNLALEVVGRRPDGYHDLRTVFQAIDLADTLRFRKRPEAGIHLRLEGPEPVPGGPGNLVVRAGEALARRLGTSQGAEILLTKRIPAGTGLGGGSSDAAAAILGLETLWGSLLDPADRAALALELGSDVPFFLQGGTALGEGRGERLRPFPPPPACGWLLAVPEFRMATPEAYRALSPDLTGRKQVISMLESACIRGEFEVFVENLVNDLEVGVVRIQPRLARIEREIRARGAAFVGLTGSGSALFAVFRSQGDADPLVGMEIPGGAVRLLACAPVGYGARVISRNPGPAPEG